ncbi:transcriptional regulator with XRE-family HTH domain [Methylobacterium brachiatum]|uniref:Transcriptional regulator with XRE-family HTH domain n=1 Tax=Methylobacterium brachiatum TaxID=269660 RepID=A0AAJ1TQY9_9HYPH|nr:helix-turn-helix domain-containing protein [Methylobacterium brachiatum]MCB4804295.1 helix-turn-helix domain-containing protein [Methylobacterium brachiatum]MDQ0545315.1 transcriptional regulator with XRE-family HTH domain [Methylobacterium brachiatum]
MPDLNNASLSPLIRRIIALCSARGWSQSQLARISGLDRRVISSLMRGDQESARAATLDALAYALNTTAAYLRGETTDQSIPRTSSLIPARPAVRVRTGMPLDEVPIHVTAVSVGHAPIEEDAGADDAEERAHWAAAPLDPVIAFWLTSPHMPTSPQDRYGNGGFRGALPLFTSQNHRSLVVTAGSQAPETVPRPPQLWGIAGAYVVEAPGGLEPRYRSGERLFIAPGIQLSPGDDVLTLTRIRSSKPNGSDTLLARCCRLNTFTNREVSVCDLRTGEASSLDLSEVEFLHRVIMTSVAHPPQRSDPQ